MAKRAARRRAPRGSIREAFFAAFSETVEAVDIPHKVIAKEADVGLSSISCYKGVRVPEEPGPVERIYKVLEGEAREQGERLPHSLPYLLALRMAATVEKTDPGAASELLESLLRKPAPDARVRSRKRRGLHARRKAARLAVRAEVPVPHQKGDRHLANNKHAADIADYVRHIEEDQLRHAQFIAWVMGTNIEPCEFPQMVAAFRVAGAEEGIEAMLNAAANRNDIQASINAAIALLSEGQVADAQAILGAIRTAE
ncbi:hypothetical protein [Streptomyces aureoverticillatus]|uniref:hypothetical protein n=1 Tax=Streptomyces aureoverticillatus TaxID=66871 RepID=UPI0013DC7958|nr:hypothetical protein [Streptomyces aureoverticillatus]QIB45584.1 hypothetical protein G3H79_23425 [Streptomyces aureoverticillatus]